MSGTPEFQDKVIKLKGPDFDFRTYMGGAMPYFLNQLVGTCAAHLYIITHTPYTLICNITGMVVYRSQDSSPASSPSRSVIESLHEGYEAEEARASPSFVGMTLTDENLTLAELANGGTARCPARTLQYTYATRRVPPFARSTHAA